jgi:hypothetical protein
MMSETVKSILDTMDTVISIIFWVMAIIVLIRLFQRKGLQHVVLGVVSLGIYPFIWGWVKNKEEDLRLVMIIWSLTILGIIVMLSVYIAFDM